MTQRVTSPHIFVNIIEHNVSTDKSFVWKSNQEQHSCSIQKNVMLKIMSACQEQLWPKVGSHLHKDKGKQGKKKRLWWRDWLCASFCFVLCYVNSTWGSFFYFLSHKSKVEGQGKSCILTTTQSQKWTSWPSESTIITSGNDACGGCKQELRYLYPALPENLKCAIHHPQIGSIS